MRQSANLLLILLWCCSVISCSNPGAEIDALFADFDRPDVPGASVIVIDHGRVVFEKGYGRANLANKTPVTPQTNFRLASCTKQFTAMAIMILAEQGKLGYDDRLNKFFPDFPTFAEQITVRHLLNHTSGLLAYEDFVPDTAKVQVLDRDVVAIVSKVDSTYFPPGTQYRYSNTGYALLAMIVEKVSGESFAGFLKAHIFAPLQMDNTVAYEKNLSTVANRAYGYTQTDSGWVFTDQSPTSAVLGDGGIYSSVADLYKWDQALYTEKLVRQATLAQAFTSAVLPDGEKINYGFGWRVEAFHGKRQIMHSGSSRGFRTVIARFPDDKLSVIILVNRNDAKPEDLASKIAEMYLLD